MFRTATYIAAALLLFTSCIREEEFNNSREDNFEALWSLVDERYCFFDIAEKEYGLNWDVVHDKYKPMAETCESDAELFDIMGKMLEELRDGHVNLVSAYGTSYYWDWKLNHHINFSDSIQRNYLGNNFRLTNGIKYKELADSIGYIYVGSFESDFGTSNLTIMLNNLKNCKGIVLDIRNNGGGMLTAAEKLASVFTDERIHYGYIQHKTGKGHNDFSSPERLYLENTKTSKWLRPVVLLTNRGVYSAANHFTMIMRELPNIYVMGDLTGGGSGMPLSRTLPNGWTVRFSACPLLDIDGNHTEFGIEPDRRVDITEEDWNRGRDTMIESAKEFILEHYDKISDKETE